MTKGQPAEWKPLDRHMDIQARLMRLAMEHKEVSRLLEQEAREASAQRRQTRPR